MADTLQSAAVSITLDGRTFELRFSAYAFIAYAEKLDRDLMRDIRELGATLISMEGATPTPSVELFTRLRDILWAGLIDRTPDLTRDETAHLFTLPEIPEVMT